MYDTNGTTVRIVELNGHDPVKLNVQPFTEDKGVGVTEDPMEGYLPIPMGIVWGAILGIALTLRFLRDKPWARGKKFIKTGVIGIIFLVIIIVVFMRVHSALPGDEGSPGPFIFEKVGASPFGGSYTGTVSGWEEIEADVEWGVDIGYWIAMIAAILFIVGGSAEYILGMRTKRELEDALNRFGRMPFQDRKPEPEPEKRKGRFRRK